MKLLNEIKAAWGWTGIDPARIIDSNKFGNLILQDKQKYFWRLCPEDLYCRIIAHDRTELMALFQNEDFMRDWNMMSLVDQAEKQFGPLHSGQAYGFKIPGILGGEYGGSNLATISLNELITISGYVAQEIQELPDGVQVQFKIVDATSREEGLE